MKPGLLIINSARQHAGRTFGVVISLLILISMACTLPVIGTPKPTPVSGPPALSPTPTPKPKTKVVIPLPPALVEAQPLPKSEIALKDAITLFFNQAMEHASVEAALQVQPAIAGRFEWLNSSTVKFTPNKPLPAASAVKFTLGTQAKASNGQVLPEPVEIQYHTVDYLKVVEQLPKPNATDVSPASAVVVTFNLPVIPLTAETRNFTPAFNLEPTASGRGEWLNTSTYIFYPQPALFGGTQYTIRLNQQITSVDGSSLASNQGLNWKFTTSLPMITTVKQSSSPLVQLDAGFTLGFNQPMDKTSVEQNYALLAPNSKPVAGKFVWNEEGSQFTFQPSALLERSSTYKVTLGKAKALGGTALAQEYTATYTTVGNLALTSTNPLAGQMQELTNGYASFVMKFNIPLQAGQNLKELVIFNPPLDSPTLLSSSYEQNTIYFSGFLNPNSEYKLTISGDLRDKWGGNLGKPITLVYKTAQARPALRVLMLQTGAFAVFVPPDDPRLGAQATNIKSVNITSATVPLKDFFSLASSYDVRSKYKPIEPTTWQQKVDIPSNRSETFDIRLTPNTKTLPTGLYYLRVNSPEVDPKTTSSTQPGLAVVSRVNIVFKVSAKQAMVWAINLDDMKPVTGSKVSFYDTTGQSLASCTTDNQGICLAELPGRKDYYATIYAVMGQPGDKLFSFAGSNWSQGLNTYDFRISSRYGPEQPLVYLYTDRPIYRPGQTVYFRAVLRQEENGRYSDLKQEKINVKVEGMYSELTKSVPNIATLSLAVSRYGTANGSFNLPEDATPGYYTLLIDEYKNTQLSFQVANYRKPDMEIQVNMSQAEIKAGQDFKATINTKYYFGAPAANQTLQWTLYSSTYYFSLPGFQTGKSDQGWLGYESFYDGELGKYITEGQLTTGADGSVNLVIPAADLLGKIDGQERQRLTLEVGLQEQAETPVFNRNSLTFHPADFYIGINAESWSVEAGREIGFSVQTSDWKRNPSGNHTLKALFQKITYRQDANPYGLPNMVPEYTLVAGADFQTDATGKARLVFTPPEPGTYQLEVSGGGAVSQVMVWVGGAGTAAWPRLPNQQVHLTADAAVYQAGQTANIFIPNPMTGNTLALVTVERAKVMRSQIITISDSSYALKLPLGEEDAPNVYVSVTLINRNQNNLDFRQGYIDLAVNPKAQLLQVELLSQPERSSPGGDVRFSLKIKDAKGKPVQGEFSLSLIDKAILALADSNSASIIQAFYGHQVLGVTTSTSLASYAQRLSNINEMGKGGGGGGAMAAKPDLPSTQVRQDFQDTAFWNGSIETNTDGVAEVSLKLPENLTTWVALVRGLTRDSLVGEAQLELVASKDFLVRPVTPRFLVLGDHVEMATFVHNNTNQNLAAEVSLQVKGFTLDEPSKATQKVEVPANDKKRVVWWGQPQAVDKVELIFNARAGSLQDASKPAYGDLPVLSYSSSQTFGTSGILAEGGQRVEIIDLPRSFTPTGGELRLEMAPSLAAVVLSSLEALDAYPRDYTEPLLSRLLPNLETYRALQELKLDYPNLKPKLEAAIQDSVSRLVISQNNDGGWGWAPGMNSTPYLSAYVLFGLSRASQSGVFVNANIIKKAQQYLTAALYSPELGSQDWQLDRLAFYLFVLQQSGQATPDAMKLYEFRSRLNPWAKAYLALNLLNIKGNEANARTLFSDLQSSASRSATGANWDDKKPYEQNLSTPNFATAVVTYALAHTDPASPVLSDAVRYLALHRQACKCWGSSYESAWVLMALVEYMKNSGDLQASFAFSASLNNSPLAKGQAGGAASLTPVSAAVPLSDLNQDAPNALQLSRDAGSGRLYYRAYLQVFRPVDGAPAVQRGLTISHSYFLADQDCRKTECKPISSVQMGSSTPDLQVKIILTVPRDMYYVVVEEFIPAGAEIVNTQLKTTKKGSTVQSGGGSYDVANPFSDGWGWWLFGSPQIFDDHIRWFSEYVPAGTYELKYRLSVLQAGEFRLIPTHAYQYYFPEVEGASTGTVFKILPVK